MFFYNLRSTIKQYLNLGRVFGYLNGFVLFLKIKFLKNIELSLSGYPFKVYLRGGTSDEAVFNQIFIKREYEIRDITKDSSPNFIIDGGANIGLGTVFFKKLFPNAKIIAIEPSEENFKLLKANTSFYNDVHLLKGAIWDKEQNLNVGDKYKQGYFSLVVSEDFGDDNTKETTPSFTIQGLFEKFGIQQLDILKLDVETAEKQIFTSNYESWLGKCKYIIIELHDIMLKGCSQTFFNAIHQSIGNYSMYIKGENIVIVNEDL